MEVKKNKIGMVVGRMSPPNKGHQQLIDTCLNLGCEKVLVILGNCDEINYKNPFSFELREQMLKSIYGSKIECLPLYNNKIKEYMKPYVFGEYLFNMCYKKNNQYPDVYTYGFEEIRKCWFDDNTIKNTIMIQIPRNTFEYTGTEGREDLLNNNKSKWKEFHDVKIHKYYEKLRENILKTV